MAMSEKELSDLLYIQANLKAPKKQQTKGLTSFKYRNAEQIYENLKPLLLDRGCILTFTSKVELIGVLNEKPFIYQHVKGTFIDSKGNVITSEVYVKEENPHINGGQLSGATLSYAQKYILGQLFLIDGSDDLDEVDKPQPTVDKPQPTQHKDKPTEKEVIAGLTTRMAQNKIVSVKQGYTYLKKNYPESTFIKCVEEYIDNFNKKN